VSAPVEGKGYKRIIKLPDWPNKQKIMLKSQKKFTFAKIYLVILYLFFSDNKIGFFPYRVFADDDPLIGDDRMHVPVRQQSEHRINKNVKCALLKEDTTGITGWLEVSIRYPLPSPEHKNGHRKTGINSRQVYKIRDLYNKYSSQRSMGRCRVFGECAWSIRSENTQEICIM
jgi:hypothetical protein